MLIEQRRYAGIPLYLLSDRVLIVNVLANFNQIGNLINMSPSLNLKNKLFGNLALHITTKALIYQPIVARLEVFFSSGHL